MTNFIFINEKQIQITGKAFLFSLKKSPNIKLTNFDYRNGMFTIKQSIVEYEIISSKIKNTITNSEYF